MHTYVTLSMTVTIVTMSAAMEQNWCKHGIAWIAWIVPNLLDRQLAGKLVSGGYLLYVSTYRFAA